MNDKQFLKSAIDLKDIQSHKEAHINQIKIQSIKISLASPETIESWSKGEVTKPETINYKSLKPEKNGLFDEAIFGPVKDYECACGKYKKVKYKGRRCEVCNVEITESLVRRERMGHIKLTFPVAHMWMTKELPLPSKISLVLGMSYKQVEEVVYFVNYVVLEPNFVDFGEENLIFHEKEVLNIDAKNPKNSRSKIRTLLRKVSEQLALDLGEKHPKTLQAKEYYKGLEGSSLPYSIHDVFNFLEEHTGLKVGKGAEAILYLLQKIDLVKLEDEIDSELKELSSKHDAKNSDVKIKKALRRLNIIRNFRRSKNNPEWMILKVIPVIPPDLRPIIQLEGGKFTTSDINTFYRRIIIRNERLKKLMELQSFPVILESEKRMLQEAVDSLIDNGSRKRPLSSKDKHLLKSLTEHLKGKQGLFRQNLLGKRVDYSGRSVIVTGPSLKMYQVGLPVDIILKLFKPFIIKELIKTEDDFGNKIKPLANSIRSAEKMILTEEDEIWPIVQKVIKERPVLLNRAPTLHRLGIQAFEVKLVEGKAIQLHPLVTTAFNADFDGDQMAVHLPITKEAIAEARSILLAPWHILGPKDGKPVITPTQDMILGIYYLTLENKQAKGTGTLFATKDEALHAYALGKVDVHAIVGVDPSTYPQKNNLSNDGILMTTIGKIILNDVFPDDFNYVNEKYPIILDEVDLVGPNYQYKNIKEYLAHKQEIPAFNKSVLAKLIDQIYKQYPAEKVPEVLDKIKDLAFEYSMKSSITVSAFDVPVFQQKYEWIEAADKEVLKQKYYFNKGLLTDDERYKKVISIWNAVKDKVSLGIKSLMKEPEHKNNSIMIMAESGARGNVSNFTQLSGMRGLMNKSYNYEQKSQTQVIHDVIEVPIKHSFIEGLTVTEYFNSSYGARKGSIDTAMKTAKSGYMTRKLVDAAQEIIVKSIDCGTKKGLLVSDIEDIRQESKIEELEERILNRFANANYYDQNQELIVGQNQLIDEEIANKLKAAGIREVEVRSILTCLQPQGVCQRCFGSDLTTNKPIALGTAIGVIAAQSIGEPGTQLTMRTFHSGGVAGEANITQGFERLKQLFEMITPKDWEKAIITEIDGKVVDIIESQGQKLVIVESQYDRREYKVDLNFALRVKLGHELKAGDKITEGSIDLRQLLKVAGIDAVRNYLIKEVQKVYRLQGIEIADKYVEVIIRQLTYKVQIQNPNDSNYVMHDIVDLTEFIDVCNKLLLDRKTPPTAINIIYGLDEAPAKTNSFLSAASFQDTKKILTDAATKGQIDYLHSLKENVIMGNLIPAGTGLKSSEEILAEAKPKFDY